VRRAIEALEVMTGAAARREGVARLCEEMTAGASRASLAEALGARPVLIKALDRAVRDDDEMMMDAIGSALGKASEMAKRESSVELRSVAGSQVGERAGAKPSTLEVRLPVSDIVVRVHESEWRDAGLAWRVWGSSQIMSRCLDAAPELVRALDVLEIGAGCGLAGLTAARVGAKRVRITDGAPGAIDAIARSVSELPPECAATTKAMFLDFRDDDDILAGVVSLEQARASNEARHWVHARSAAHKSMIESCKLPVDDVFDVVLATDVLYSDEHAAPLAASLTRRIRPGGCGYILNACRHGGILADFTHALLSRGMRLQISAIERFDGEDDVKEYQGGHLHRALPPQADAWWTASAKELVKFGASTIVADEEASIAMLADVDVLREFMTSFEGRFIFIRVSRPDVDATETPAISDRAPSTRASSPEDATASS
jgi:predicted nicotinamide N-methyase